jgi:hypothetical protein
LCRFWSKYEVAGRGCRVKAALLTVARKFLTPPSTSTNVERLFSYCGQIASKRRGSLAPFRLEQIIFLRENLAMLNFKLNF